MFILVLDGQDKQEAPCNIGGAVDVTSGCLGEVPESSHHEETTELRNIISAASSEQLAWAA